MIPAIYFAASTEGFDDYSVHFAPEPAPVPVVVCCPEVWRVIPISPDDAWNAVVAMCRSA